MFECPSCDSTFEHQRSLWLHKKSNHKNKIDEIFDCNICQAKFPTKYKLNSHIKNVHTTEEVKCEICEKTFRNKFKLKMHTIEVHYEGENLKCDHCEKSYRFRNLLRKHIKSSHSEKTYECEICLFRFYSCVTCV